MAEENGTWGKRIALATGVVGLVAAVLALWINWDTWILGKQECRIAGTIAQSISGEPVQGAQLGWVSGGAFHQFAQSGADGTFAGSCKGAEDNPGSGNFQLVYWLGEGAGLPDLDYQFSGQYFENSGSHEGVNVLWFPYNPNAG